MTHCLAIDLGGTQLRLASAAADDPAGLTMLGTGKAPATCEALRAGIAAALAPLDAAAGETVAVGLTVPGLVEGTRCRWVPNLPYLDGVDIATLFPGRAVAVGNDAQLALLAEATCGAAAGLTDVVLLAIGTGIGSAVLAGGRILRGAHGGACSFGWACADLDDAGDPRDGWLERQAAGRALDRLGGAYGDGAGLVAAARAGDAVARAKLEHPARSLGIVLAGAVALLDPQAILLAGGVAASADVLLPALLDALRRHLPPHLRDVPVRAGTFGPRAALIGAAVAAARAGEWERMT